jgi:hypothetical protein
MVASDAKPFPLKNTAYRITFPILDADGDLVAGAAGIDSEISKDGAIFSDCTNEAAEIATASGMYYLDLSAAEMNADTVGIIVKTTTSGAKTTPIVLYPVENTDIPVNVKAIGDTVQSATDLKDFADTGYDPAGHRTQAQIKSTDDIDLSATQKASLNAEVDTALVDIRLDHLIAVADADDPVNNSIIAKMAASDGIWSGFDKTTDALEAIRDRGDGAWITGGGGGITDILQVIPSIPVIIDLADTKTIRLALYLLNSLDDLPSTVEITAGTITIDRSADGGTSWSTIVNAVACSEQAGQIYYDEVFDSGSGYVNGDMIRITFKGQKITVSANDYEITDSTYGWMFHTSIDPEIGASASECADAVWDEAISGHVGAASFGVKNQKVVPSESLADYKATGFSTHAAADIWSVGTRALTDKVGFGLSSAATQAIWEKDISAYSGAKAGAYLKTLYTDWLNAGRLDLILDAIAADVVNLDGAAMRGTDSASLASVCTEARLAELAAANLPADVDAILTDTGTDGVVVASGSKSGYSLSDVGIDGILDEVVEGTLTFREMLRLFMSVLSGKTAGGGTVTLTARDVADTKNRITATVDANGNRSTIVLDGG